MSSAKKWKLKLVGLWVDNRDDDSSEDDWFTTKRYLHPRDIVDESWCKDEREKIVTYLRRPEPGWLALGYCHNRFMDDEVPDYEPFPQLSYVDSEDEMGTGMQSDGVWLWPVGLATYVEKYSVRLPEQFVEHMREKNWDPSSEIDLDSVESRDLESSEEFWLEWCAIEKALVKTNASRKSQ